MTRELALESLKVAFLTGDTATATRIYVENRISNTVFNQYRQEYSK